MELEFQFEAPGEENISLRVFSSAMEDNRSSMYLGNCRRTWKTNISTFASFHIIKMPYKKIWVSLLFLHSE